MTESGADLLALLRDLDDPQWLEWPAGYDRNAVAARFGELVVRLESDFTVRCGAERDTQDSSEYGRVVVPAEATACGTRIVVCVSKFGFLVGAPRTSRKPVPPLRRPSASWRSVDTF
ncbi:hypothetical protein ACFWP2_12040 [Kitasatospora sp. NPDC058444]|uniref:hypothetical protein n=1 Tax=Kitasatospora sp. NPDC058444 TaxID=3346504 RepID=UPI0036541116